MEVVTIATPGSLTVASTSIWQDCDTLPVVDAAKAASIVVGSEGPGTNISYGYSGPSGSAFELVTRVLYTGSYILPQSPCGICNYHVYFNATALLCDPVDLTESIIASDTLPVGLGEMTLWNSSSGWSESVPSHLSLTVASRNLSSNDTDYTAVDNSATVAFVCTGYNAAYTVLVYHNQTGTSDYYINSVELLEPYTRDQSLETTNDPSLFFGLAIWDAFRQQFSGTVTLNESANALTFSAGTIIVNSPFTTSPSSNILWQWQVDLINALPSLMQNISLSLISGVLFNSSLSDYNTGLGLCTVTDLHFVYDRVRLLATYGAMIGVALACLLVALVAIHINKVGETMDFSRILGGVPVFRNSVEANGKIEDYLRKRVQVHRDGDEYEYEYEGGSRMTDANLRSTIRA